MGSQAARCGERAPQTVWGMTQHREVSPAHQVRSTPAPTFSQTAQGSPSGSLGSGPRHQRRRECRSYYSEVKLLLGTRRTPQPETVSTSAGHKASNLTAERPLLGFSASPLEPFHRMVGHPVLPFQGEVREGAVWWIEECC